MYKYKYKPKIKGNGVGVGKRENPNSWCTGPDPVRHDKYYAYLKHKSQANYRKEPYSLSWEQFEQFWPDHLWMQRGRQGHNLCLRMIDPEQGWEIKNCEVVTRKEHFVKRRVNS